MGEDGLLVLGLLIGLWLLWQLLGKAFRGWWRADDRGGTRIAMPVTVDARRTPLSTT